jgi:Tol biopolymer transport system component
MNIPQALANAMQDRYRLERELGAGGMATVYLAQDLKHGRQVAVKVLHPELSAVLGGERFLSEIRTTAALQHPHILPLFDSGAANGNLFYVMPLVEGETLRSRLNRDKQLPVPDAVRLAREVAGALDYAHRHGVIHRDIKPENILLHDGRAVVADFGIALAVQSAGGQRMTQTGLSLGTPQYMSPEQAMGEREISARSDIYALGVVTYEMLTGDPPFTGSTTQSIVARILTEEPRPIGPQRKSVPEQVEAAVLTALEKLPADRFGSAAEFAAALDGGMTGGREVGKATRRVVSVVPSSRLPALLAALLLLATALAAWGWLRPRRVPAPPVTRYEVDFPAVAFVGYGSRVAVSPDGSKLVYMGPGPNGFQLWLRQRDRIEALPIPGTSGAVHPFFSPDGTRLAYALNSPSALMMMRLDGGVPAELAKNVGLAGASWGRDGYIYIDGLSRSLLKLPETGGALSDAAIPDSAGGEEDINMPHALPNGRGVIITIHRTQQPENWMVGVLDTRTGKHRSLLPGIAGYYLASGHLLVVNAQGELSTVLFDQHSLTLTGQPMAMARGISLVDPWGVDMGVGEDVVAYATAPTTLDSLELGWSSGDGEYQPVAPGWVDAIMGAKPSPDGTRIAFEALHAGRMEIWTRRLDNGSLTRLSLGSLPAYNPTWSRDSRTVYYSVVRSNAVVLVARPADGSAGETELARSTLFVSGVTTSRDGSKLVYTHFDNVTFSDLMMLAAGDTASTPLLKTPHGEHSPSISPDGRWLAYASNEGGLTDHIYVRPFPNIMETVWQVSPEEGSVPRWSADGREIFYVAGDNTIAAVEVLAGPTFALGRRRRVLSMGPYQTGRGDWGVGKDGRVLVLKRVSAPPDLKILVTQNLSAELRANPR